MLRTIPRAILLATAAFLSLATSMVFDTVESVTPLPDETGVSVDVVPTVRTTTELDMSRANVALIREADQAEIPGDVVHDNGVDGYWHLSFVPHAPLDADTDYRLMVVGALEGYAYIDPITNQATNFGSGFDDRLEVPFSTASDPRVRHSARYSGHSHIYLSFSQDMDPQTLNASTIEVYLDGAAEPPLAYTWDSGPAHSLKITMRRVDFQFVDVAILDGVMAFDGTSMLPQTIEVETSN